MTRNEAIDQYAEENEVEILRVEPAEVYDPAVIGIAARGGNHFLVYDQDMVIAQAVAHGGMDYETAVEWHSFNTFDAWLGDGTPAFLVRTTSAP